VALAQRITILIGVVAATLLVFVTVQSSVQEAETQTGSVGPDTEVPTYAAENQREFAYDKLTLRKSPDGNKLTRGWSKLRAL